ncbi:MAG: AAA family ATPase [Synergistaceae bacterium]
MTWMNPNWKFPHSFDEIEFTFPRLVRELKGCEQDPDYHSEGNVWEHTKLVIDNMKEDVEWGKLEETEREVLIASAFFHDVAKPQTTRIENGIITSPKHSVYGARMVRNILWNPDSPHYYAAPWDVREYISNLTLLHMLPFWFLDKENPTRSIGASSQVINNNHLSILSRADMMGRIKKDKKDHIESLERLELFKEFCEENDCLNHPMKFQTDKARFRYFFEQKGDPRLDYYEPVRGAVIIMVGLQGAGKDYMISKRYSHLPVVGYDSIRDEIGLKFGESESLIQQELKKRIHEHMRNKEDFVFNATNLIKDIRSTWIRRFRKYNYRINIHYIENSLDETLKNNKNRDRVVPEGIILAKFARMDVPTLLECHELEKTV